MEKYYAPEIEIEAFDEEDIIMTSGFGWEEEEKPW